MIAIIEATAYLLSGVRHEVDGPFRDPNKVQREVIQYTDGNGFHAFVAEEHNRVYGYIEIALREADLPVGAPDLPQLDGLAHIARIGVVESVRGKGIGSALLQRAEKWLRSREVDGVWLDYLAHNQAAESLYRRNNYVDIAEFPGRRKNDRRRIAIKTW